MEKANETFQNHNEIKKNKNIIKRKEMEIFRTLVQLIKE